MVYIATTEFNGHTYRVNNYMNGMCPFCRMFEAPITEEELLTASEEVLHKHKGSSPRVDDTQTAYPRQTWREHFACSCGGHFAVPFSNV
jgi:hypothetical protein